MKRINILHNLNNRTVCVDCFLNCVLIIRLLRDSW